MAGLNEDQYTEVKEGIAEIRSLAVAFARLETAIMGNGTKGLKDRMNDVEAKIESLENKPEPKVPKPRYSWPQVLVSTGVNAALIITIVGFLFSFNSDMSQKIARLEDKVDAHIVSQIKSGP